MDFGTIDESVDRFGFQLFITMNNNNNNDRPVCSM